MVLTPDSHHKTLVCNLQLNSQTKSRNYVTKFGDKAELDAPSSVCVLRLTVTLCSSVTANMGQVVEMTMTDDAK